MSSAPFEAIRKALETKVRDINLSRDTPIRLVFTGEPFDPAELRATALRAAGVPAIYARVTDLRGESFPAGIGQTGFIQHNGILDIQLISPTGEGAADLLRLAGLFMRLMTRVEVNALDETDNQAFIIKLGVPSLSPVREEPNRLQATISVPYFAHT